VTVTTFSRRLRSVAKDAGRFEILRVVCRTFGACSDVVGISRRRPRVRLLPPSDSAATYVVPLLAALPLIVQRSLPGSKLVPYDPRPVALPETIAKLLQAAAKLKTSGSGNEANTKALLIEPLIAALGWDPVDLDVVEREVKVFEGTFLDYALKLDGQPRVYVEAKGLTSIRR